MDDIRKLNRRLAIVVNNIDETYAANTKKLGMKESELCLMYALGDGEPHSQKQIYEEWLIPKTTLNTIAKQWEHEGYIAMQPIPGKRREMQVCLTAAGKNYIEQQLAVIYKAEETAMKMTIERYSPAFVKAVEYFGSCLKTTFESHFAEKEERKKGIYDV